MRLVFISAAMPNRMLLGIGTLAISATDSHLKDANHIASYRITRCKLGLAQHRELLTDARCLSQAIRGR
jgi:hypothetical protein